MGKCVFSEGEEYKDSEKEENAGFESEEFPDIMRKLHKLNLKSKILKQSAFSVFSFYEYFNIRRRK